jgi:hypothetical protein
MNASPLLRVHESKKKFSLSSIDAGFRQRKNKQNTLLTKPILAQLLWHKSIDVQPMLGPEYQQF